MPTYYSVRRGQQLELRRGGYGTVKDAVLGEMRVPIKPLMIRFRPLDVKFPVFGLPARNGYAGGILTPQDAAAQIRRRASELGPAADKLPDTEEELEKWVVRALRKHSGKGSLFVEVAEVDEVPQGSDLEAHLEPVQEAVAGFDADPVGVIVMQGDRAYCRACDMSMDKRGVNGHRRKKDHLAKVQAKTREMQEAVSA